ncbi:MULTISPECIES: WGR domain-containing protein [Chelatococcus]|uniref:Putative DNA-binding WGR domain protein n=2 Tax=Chelatococcaceae TaxID=2036754 RepID=A0A2V3TR70_9HYPH|nr:MULTISPECIES: WGR domain-containing protein [Chelatococcus]CAH1687435.1 putative DNA-binding WGR domain protein [Hyphomicrobiales bacterium]MBS7707822.1 WGR domain-containing protein [Chelatococcus asaccharovorans]MBS7743520.1 WGR domain-containing protein [Chelatococcus sp. HY11]MBS7743699.1 WGR domain-containing protein [Chelatococcus sp. HY11]MBX3547211.1 WGR domain-containing protein [Chelatococcus sp.]
MPEPSIQYLVLERTDAAHNIARYYVLSLEPTLFAEMALVRRWGRIGRAGGHRVEFHETQAGATEALQTWLKRKLRRSYRLTGASKRPA